jgi:hypothetical protein
MELHYNMGFCACVMCKIYIYLILEFLKYSYTKSAIPADMLHRTWQELEYRLDVLRATNWAHVEVHW